jgi:transcription termination factor NusB
MSGSARQARSVARLAAAQALYQMETAGAGAETVIREFSDHRFNRDLEGLRLKRCEGSGVACSGHAIRTRPLAGSLSPCASLLGCRRAC